MASMPSLLQPLRFSFALSSFNSLTNLSFASTIFCISSKDTSFLWFLSVELFYVSVLIQLPNKTTRSAEITQHVFFVYWLFTSATLAFHVRELTNKYLGHQYQHVVLNESWFPDWVATFIFSCHSSTPFSTSRQPSLCFHAWPSAVYMNKPM